MSPQTLPVRAHPGLSTQSFLNVLVSPDRYLWMNSPCAVSVKRSQSSCLLPTAIPPFWRPERAPASCIWGMSSSRRPAVIVQHWTGSGGLVSNPALSLASSVIFDA